MDIRKLQRAIVDGLEDVKAQNIAVFNTEHLSALFERVIIASGTSNRQTKSLASGVREAVRKAGYPAPRTEGEANGEWIIVDCGAAVVHVMQPTIRDYYHLEEIWGDKPVNIKLASATTRLVKAAEPDAVAAPPASRTRGATSARPAGAGDAAVRSPTAKKKARSPAPPDVAARKLATPARKLPLLKSAAAKTAVFGGPTARKAAAKKAAMPSGHVVTRVVGVKKVASKKVLQTKAAAKKAAPTKVAAKKATAKVTAPKVAAKKVAAKKVTAKEVTAKKAVPTGAKKAGAGQAPARKNPTRA